MGSVEVILFAQGVINIILITLINWNRFSIRNMQKEMKKDGIQ
jgi:hypothetical protein